MKISALRFYGGSREKVCRLALAHIFLELQEILISTQVEIQDKIHANGAGEVRKRIDEGFIAANVRNALGKSKKKVSPLDEENDDWKVAKSGDIDWVKRFRYDNTIVTRMGVEIQVSGRSDLLARDIIHIRNNLQDSIIDIGVIVVPSDEFAYRLTDRVASLSYAIKYVETELREAQTYPIILIAIEHDGYSDIPQPKTPTNTGKGAKKEKVNVVKPATDSVPAPMPAPKLE